MTTYNSTKKNEIVKSRESIERSTQKINSSMDQVIERRSIQSYCLNISLGDIKGFCLFETRSIERLGEREYELFITLFQQNLQDHQQNIQEIKDMLIARKIAAIPDPVLGVTIDPDYKKKTYNNLGIMFTKKKNSRTLCSQPCMDHDRQSGEGLGPQEYLGIKSEVVQLTPELKPPYCLTCLRYNYCHW
ncbi:hypothetical protein CONCODRAFT_8014 [Conidiobolus coronatus NRRL 28638]|uniref:Uncharacterized protein n=1 Tax=Conidiobolus coronatus (strain ATCC 28846 / CBS 209.66 / NRRL 28638) TaxID=796925 RepID=A0A137P3V6_CONC2|nr:hypothetical protein CONCODRAFT_8014 [Conidiobolus coronatus NRRL 28638]|eukprot:KXN69591.1 hypothetical protein CONCODRAFT_8014 [Conidiobolus coronatus NRRL 28638]